MSQLDPLNTTVNDICTAALKVSMAYGVGQTPTAEDTSDAWAALQWMLQQWERKRWLVYHLVTLNVVSTGVESYTVGPGGQIDTGAGSVRPDKIEAAFLRQLTQSPPNQIDYPLTLLQSMEDYSRIALKSLKSFPTYVFYDPAWGLGNLFAWPVPQANIYGVYIVVKEQLPAAFATLATKFALPYEYYAAMVYNLGLRLRPKYGIITQPGDELRGIAKDALNVLRGGNTAIARLQMPTVLQRGGIYNIFSDRIY